MKKKLAKVIRIISTAPIVALIFVSTLYLFVPESFQTVWEYLFSVTVLSLLPLLAYPTQWIFKIDKEDTRAGERKTAIVFSVIGYVVGAVITFVFNFTDIQKIFYLTYLLSGATIAFSSFVLKIKASGHMCGVAGPIAAMVYFGGPGYLGLTIFLGFVIWSSLYLGRHSPRELVYGTLIPVGALVLALLIVL
ncbi:MAG TPA: hypothetical protein PLH02_03505 [Bacillota bacterium]|nr:hypothetical protein [Bacillota bacterium]HPF42849.1 hypothetical protein [Bacillota bacterium]HPJ85461.1 hypothetical protein [Bacillota bacterium]HPQ61917.1 hypothetical protein [Bacillota bacterium]